MAIHTAIQRVLRTLWISYTSRKRSFAYAQDDAGAFWIASLRSQWQISVIPYSIRNLSMLILFYIKLTDSSWISSTLTEFRQRNFVPIVFSSHPEFISGSILHWSLQSNFGKMLKQVQHDWNIVITEIRWIKLRVTREVIYNSDIPYLIQNLSILILSYLITYLPIHFSKEILHLRLWITLLC